MPFDVTFVNARDETHARDLQDKITLLEQHVRVLQGRHVHVDVRQQDDGRIDLVPQEGDQMRLDELAYNSGGPSPKGGDEPKGNPPFVAMVVSPMPNSVLVTLDDNYYCLFYNNES